MTRIRPASFLLALLALTALPAVADPAPPRTAPVVAGLEVGVFCALEAMGRAPAPGTRTGWIHVPDREITFHWPDQQIVPASIGLAFGVSAQLAPGEQIANAEIRVYQPGSQTPEIWGSNFYDIEPSVSFFRFDHPHELIQGLWRFEAWDGAILLYSVEFEVVPAEAIPKITQACGAVS
jgi:hypothetical protein